MRDLYCDWGAGRRQWLTKGNADHDDVDGEDMHDKIVPSWLREEIAVASMTAET